MRWRRETVRGLRRKVDVLAFRVAEEPGRIPVDVRCACGEPMMFRHVYVAPSAGRRSQVGETTGLCPCCGRPIHVSVRVEVDARLLLRFETTGEVPQ
jgi:hypothetical protein